MMEETHGWWYYTRDRMHHAVIYKRKDWNSIIYNVQIFRSGTVMLNTDWRLKNSSCYNNNFRNPSSNVLFPSTRSTTRPYFVRKPIYVVDSDHLFVLWSASVIKFKNLEHWTLTIWGVRFFVIVWDYIFVFIRINKRLISRELQTFLLTYNC